MSGPPNRDYEHDELRRRRDALEDVGRELVRRQPRRLEGGERRPQEVRWQAHREKERGESPTGRAERGRSRERARGWPVVERGERSAGRTERARGGHQIFIPRILFQTPRRVSSCPRCARSHAMQLLARIEKEFHCCYASRIPFVASLLALCSAETLLNRRSSRSVTQTEHRMWKISLPRFLG